MPKRKYKRGPTLGLTNPEITSRRITKDGERNNDKDIEEGKKEEKQKALMIWKEVPKTSVKKTTKKWLLW